MTEFDRRKLDLSGNFQADTSQPDRRLAMDHAAASELSDQAPGDESTPKARTEPFNENSGDSDPMRVSEGDERTHEMGKPILEQSDSPDDAPTELDSAKERPWIPFFHWKMTVGSEPENWDTLVDDVAERLVVHDAAPESDQPRDVIASDYLVQHPDLLNHWWINVDAIDDRVDGKIFRDTLPREQLIVGRDGKGVRFFNFGPRMYENRQADCRKFVDILTQYFGDRTFDFVQDVVIADFKRPHDDTPKTDDDLGFVLPTLPGVIFIDAELLYENAQATDPRITEGGRFLEVLVHEAGHQIQGNSEQDLDQLLDFAKNVGWNVDALLTHDPYMWDQASDLTNYAPPAMTDVAASLKGGSPTFYGRIHPAETAADVTSYIMLGDFVLQHMPDTRDAWLEYMQKRLVKPGERPKPGGRPIAAPSYSASIFSEIRKGSGIVYPKVQLPDRIEASA